MTGEIKKGSAELAVLSVLAEEPLHGYEIARRIDERTDGALRFTLATLYPTLYRLERKGWTRAEWGVAPNGRKRRSYSLTVEGHERAEILRDAWRDLFHALDRLAEGGLHA
jgi:DNA-binding PadR family transcriptional regulator